MNKLKRILATLNHEEPDVVPNDETFSTDIERFKFAPRFDTGNWRRDIIDYLEFMDNYIVDVGNGGIQSKIIQEDEGYRIEEFETGARRKYVSALYEGIIPLSHPVIEEKDLDNICLPDPNDPRRYEGVEEKIRFFKERGYFIRSGINGFFSTVHYHLRRLEDFWVDTVLNKNFAKRMIDMMAEFNLKAAENLLKRGTFCISFPDDLGTIDRLFVSPKFFKEYILPWYRDLVDLCHSYGAYVYMHSDGNINEIMDLLVDAKIDILHPITPEEGMNLKMLKEKYGRRITFDGGASKFVGQMNQQQLEALVEEIIRVGSAGGGYIFSTCGGITYDMSQENFEFYKGVVKKYREKYGSKRGEKN